MSVCKFSRILFCIILISIFVLSPLTVWADEPVKEGVDVVLLIDTSGSMRASDRGRNAIEAVNLFIDMLQTKYSRVSVLAFNDEISVVMDMTEVNSLSDKEKMKSIISGFVYDGFTDIGVPLLEGVNKLLHDSRPENSPMLVLLTDGKIEMDPERTDRSDEDSYADITQSLALAGNRFPIYTIGLNYDNSVDEQLLHTIASTTNGRSYMIHEAAALPQIFNEIFADHIESSLIEVASFQTDGEAYNELVIDIQSDFVSEANIIILSGEELADVKLFNPHGVEADFNQEAVTYSKSKIYSIIKVLTPERGEWLLKTKGVKGDKIRVNLLYQYDAAINMAVSQNGPSKAEYDSLAAVQVVGTLWVNGNEYTDSWLYQETQATLFVERENELVAEIPLTVQNNRFAGEYLPPSDDALTFYIKVENENFAKTSNKSNISFEPVAVAPNTPPVVAEEPTEPTEPAVTEEDLAPEPPATTVEPEKQPLSKGAIASIVVIIVTVIVLLLVTIFLYPWKKGEKFFAGHIEFRLKDKDGKYTPMETPLLHTYVNSFTLPQFIADNLKQATVNKITSIPVDLKQITFYPGKENDNHVIYVENKSNCPMLCENGGMQGSTTEHVWKNNERLIFKLQDNRNTAVIEMTYRTEENS